MPNITIVQGYTPGSIGRVAESHGTYYHVNWRFGLFFEAKVASELSEFLKRYDENRDGFWAVSVAGRVEGAISIDGMHHESEGRICDGLSCLTPCGGKARGTSSSIPLSAAGTRGALGCICEPLKGSGPQGTYTKRRASGLSRNTGGHNGERKSANSDSSVF